MTKNARETRAAQDVSKPELGLYLREEDPRPAKVSFVITSFLFIGLFLMAFPQSDRAEVPEAYIEVPVLYEYTPPVKEPPKIEKRKPIDVPKIALPDPTPADPEPYFEPPPEPEAEPIASDVVIRRGMPKGPPVRPRADPVREGTMGLENPRLVKDPRPDYPAVARRAQFEGTVIIEAVIGSDGRVKRTRLLRGVGRFGLDEAALEAVRKRVYEPGRLEGRPVEVLSTIHVSFRLR
ncbi:MAG: TonB family protein [Acidobacteriota bacterium]